MEPDNTALENARAIEDFVAGRLGDTDRAAFVERLRTDLALRTAVDAERMIQQAKGLEHVAKFKQVLAEVAEQVEAEERSSGGGRVLPIQRAMQWRWWAAAASVAVVLGVSLLFFTGQDTDYRALALAELERPLSNVRSGAVITDQVDSLHQEATTRLLGGQHEDFLRFSARLMEDSLFAVRHGERSRLDRAYALLKLERPAEARAELAGVETTDPSITAERAYYLSLAHLMEENPEAARSALDSVDAPFPWDERVARLREGMGL